MRKNLPVIYFEIDTYQIIKKTILFIICYSILLQGLSKILMMIYDSSVLQCYIGNIISSRDMITTNNHLQCIFRVFD